MKYYYFPSTYKNMRRGGMVGKDWIVGKYHQMKHLWEKIKSIPGAIAGFFLDIKNRAVSSLEDMWNRFKNWLKKLGINIYTYGKPVMNSLKNAFTKAISVSYQILKRLGKMGVWITENILKILSKIMKNTGWSPVEIVLAIHFLRNPPTYAERQVIRGIRMLPNIVSATVQSLIDNYMFGGGSYLSYGAGKKRRGRFIKGSPEAKAYMTYLRSLRRN